MSNRYGQILADKCKACAIEPIDRTVVAIPFIPTVPTVPTSLVVPNKPEKHVNPMATPIRTVTPRYSLLVAVPGERRCKGYDRTTTPVDAASPV